MQYQHSVAVALLIVLYHLAVAQLPMLTARRRFLDILCAKLEETLMASIR